MCAHMQSQLDRMQTDRVLRMLHATGRAIRQKDRTELPLPPECSMAPPGSLQSERLPKMCSLVLVQPNLSACTLRTP